MFSLPPHGPVPGELLRAYHVALFFQIQDPGSHVSILHAPDKPTGDRRGNKTFPGYNYTLEFDAVEKCVKPLPYVLPGFSPSHHSLFLAAVS